ncbi:hypothetical protein EKG38_15295 [Shewanella canadensis]|uniref:EcxA zinc-binding domain-containing protein n=1 Tax=Shewanella canadensis TaxID=271096 RepID=A0A3S0J4R5_9GAMM|nr:zinc-dependent metalloprotease [Shewanella canadensis]RTR37934.1 hypothetical protein EKG38_15295 [Shewanella canadensis]
MNKSMLCLAITGAWALTGCGAGEEPYKELPKDEKQITTADIDKAGERQYLYIRSVGKAPRYAASIRGFSQGTPKLVTLRKTANGIQVRQIDRDAIGLDHDSRYDDEYNEAPVLTIPGKYIDYKCTEDRWRECINVEEENKDADLKWQDKNYFVPDFAETKIAELGINDLFMFGQCVTETEDPRLVNSGDWKGYEMDLAKGVINFEIEHTYQAEPQCLNKFYNGSLDNLSFTSTEYISIVAIDELANKDYQAIPYSPNENGTYGFFTSDHSYRDATDSSGVDGYVRTYMNRVDPTKKTLTYYLSNNFFLPKNKPYLDAAHQTITALNIENKLYKTGFPELVIEQALDKRHGDLRYSNITLFDEPLDNGLAGYGPSAANPATGEIVSARVNQYSSNLKQGAVRYYRQVRLDYNRGKLDASSAAELTGVPYSSTATATEVKVSGTSADSGMFAKPETALEVAASALPKFPVDNTFENLLEFDADTQAFWSENSMMHVDTVFAEGGKNRELPRGVKDHEINWKNPSLWVDGNIGNELIAFEDMPISLQDELTTQLAAQAFAGTLSHELGHTFGLRHNFSGSTDADNTFSEAELKALNDQFSAAGYPNLTAKAEFSSQMDYNVNRFATMLQPYDLAALRFGYAREVELKGEPETATQFVSLKEEDEKRRQELIDGNVNGDTRFGALYNIAQQHDLRSYSFCTDGHVSLNSNCNRGDAGENLNDIAQFYIDKYNDSYETANLRHNRQTLFEDHTLSYTVGRKRRFDEIRQFVEDISSLENIFGLPENYFVEPCKDDSATAWYCSNQRALNNAAQFFLTLAGENDASVDVTFKMVEDGSVAMRKSYNFAELLAQYRFKSGDMKAKLEPGEVISKFSDSPEALKDLILNYAINPSFHDKLDMDVAFSGRLLNGIKVPASSPNHPYVNERDVLGVWPDKLLAVRALVSRTTARSTTGRGYKALVDLPEVGNDFKDMLCKMVMGDGPGLTNGGTALFVESCGASGKLNELLPNYVDFATQSIEPLPNYDRMVSRYFGFDTVNGQPKGKSNLLELMLRQVVLASVDSDYQGEQKARIWREYVGIHLAGPALDSQAEIKLNGRIYVATSENTLAMNLITRIQSVEAFIESNPGSMDIKLTAGTVGEILNGQLERDRLVLTYLPVLY